MEQQGLLGGIAQLGERLHGMQEVSGSIPLTSTSKAVRSKVVLFKSPSSRGLGHHPFTVSTGVRIPLGTPDSRFVWYEKSSDDSGLFSFKVGTQRISARTYVYRYCQICKGQYQGQVSVLSLIHI